MSAEPITPKISLNLSEMEKAWIELGAAQSLPPEQIFYQGWISRGFFDLDQIHARAVATLNETDALKTD